MKFNMVGWIFIFSSIIVCHCKESVVEDSFPLLRSFDMSCTSLLWLVGFQTKGEEGEEVFYLADNSEYVHYLKVAILSARKNAPALIPVIIFTGSMRGNSELVFWIERHGGYVLHHKLSFHKELKRLSEDPQWSFSQNLWGSWLRIDIPAIMSQVDVMMARLRDNGYKIPRYSKENILWTDPDVIFGGPIDSCTLSRPLILSVGPEVGMGTAQNFGVIYFNVSGYNALSPDMFAWAKKQDFHFEHDQDLMVKYIGNRVNALPDAYNWKPYWGNGTSARKPPYPGSEVQIVHFHGPKIKLATCYFKKLKNYRVPLVVPRKVQWDIVRTCGQLKTPTENGKGDFGHLGLPYIALLAHILFEAYRVDQGDFYFDLQQKFQDYQKLELQKFERNHRTID